MNRILFVVLAGLLILSIFVSGCGGPCAQYLAPVEDVAIWVDESLSVGNSLAYFLYVVAGWSSCDSSSRYEVTMVGNTTLEVYVFRVTCYPDCPVDRYATHNISILHEVGQYFVSGVNYTIKVNDLTITFVAGVMTYPAPIHDIEIWADNSSPSQYFADVVSGEPSICDHFNSYNVTRASNTTIIVDISNLNCGTGCPVEYSYVENTIPLGSDFVSGGNYTVMVNDVTETFVAQ
jgi:hypothetical protein